MARSQVPFYALNAGEIDPDALGRIDLEKLRVAGETMVNFVPTVLGGMHMRPGTKFVGETKNSASTRLIPFVFNATTTSLIEISNTAVRVRNNDALIYYPTYSTTITNGEFNSAMGTGWTNQSTTGASATISGGRLVLQSTNYALAKARQAISVPTTFKGTLHAVRIEVARGPVTFRIGTSAGADNIIADQSLGTGTHFISFTPNNESIFFEFEANVEYRGARQVEACTFVKNETMELPSYWLTSDLNDIRYAQSGSVIFVACKGKRPYRIERRNSSSWSISQYTTTAGPYVPYNGSMTRLKASDTVGDITLTSDRPFFKQSMVGAVFEMTFPTQTRKERFVGPDQHSGHIKVSGVGASDRTIRYSATYASGASGTVWLEKAVSAPDNWKRSPRGDGTISVSSTRSVTFCDSDTDLGEKKAEYPGNDNVIVYYRLMSGSTTTGQIDVTIWHNGGTIQTGVVRITGWTSSTSVTAEVIDELGAADVFTEDWREGAWSDNQSWPSAVCFYDGRLWWGGLDKVYGSVSDDYSNFNPNTLGDSGPIIRSIATGPVENIGWLLPLQRLIVGTASSEVSIRSSSFDEPLTPSQFTARNASTMGSAAIQAVTVDSTGMYVQKNRSKIYELLYDASANDYASRDLTRLNKNICKPGVVDIAVQRQPDTRVWFVKSDGTMALLVYERSDEVVGWARFEMDGAVENVCCLTSETDDIIYVIVRRTIGGQTKRYLERLTVSSETEDGDGTWLVDSAVQFSAGGVATRTITGLGHLVGKQVVAKGASSDPTKRFTVSANGQITIDNAVTSLVVGLPYEAKFKTVKLAYGSNNLTAVGQKKRVDHLGIVANNTAPDGVEIGRDFDNTTRLSNLLRGRPLTSGQIVSHYDYDATSFGGAWDSDSRVCIKCNSPYPAHILGFVVKMNTNDKVFAWQKQQAVNET